LLHAGRLGANAACNDMAQQLLWIEACLKLAGGLALVTAPRGLARLRGLPSADDRFWPRLLGGVLIGLAAASLIEGRRPGAGGLGVAGSIAVTSPARP